MCILYLSNYEKSTKEEKKMEFDYEKITAQAKSVICELIEKTALKKGQLLVIGCSSSEILGNTIGHGSSVEAAQAVFDAVYPILKEHGIYLAAQCCEHLNRALIIEREAAVMRGYEEVNVYPVPKAGGSFATAAYHGFADPVAVEHIQADAGLDIGLTLVGMHLKHVAVPVRLQNQYIGSAPIVCARTRAKFIGGARANYHESLM